MKLVAITACPTGVAHTYMAAEKLEQNAKKLGYEIRVEKQGALGIEDRLTSEEINDADFVIFAVETAVLEEERFGGKMVYRCPVALPIKENTAFFNDIEIKAKLKPIVETKGTKINSKDKTLKQHILTGVSHIIPIVIAASVIMGIARIGGMIYGVTDIWDAVHADASGLIPFFHTLDGMGGTALGLMLPILAGYIAYSMAGKPGLASGFTGGMIAANIGAGFFGALFAGLFAGYFTVFLINKIKIKGAAASLGPVFLIPVLSVLVTALMTQYVIGYPFTLINEFLINFLTDMSSGSVIVMAIVLGAMVGFDLGGPVNKAAVVTAMGLIVDGVYLPNTAVQVAIIVPTLGYGIATIIKGAKFSEGFKNAGHASFIMGIVGVSEGAIPFTLANPKKLVSVNMIGCAVGSAIAVGFGAINSIPISGIYGWLLVDKWYFYVIGIIIGACIVAAGALWASDSFTGDDVESLI